MVSIVNILRSVNEWKIRNKEEYNIEYFNERNRLNNLNKVKQNMISIDIFKKTLSLSDEPN
jgi:hypothetical protein